MGNGDLESIVRLSRDLREAAQTMTAREARYLVDGYYQIQDQRIRSAAQIRSAGDEPHAVLAWFMGQNELLERNIKRALDAYGDRSIVGQWSKSIIGIGPVLSAGLLAHLDLEPWRCAVAHGDPKTKPCRPETPHDAMCARFRVNTVGQIWRFAGLDPTQRWGKGEKRPWNARLKVLCWKIGESFVKTSGHPEGFYGRLYVERRAREDARNVAGLYADQAAASLTEKRWRDGTATRAKYEAGLLPDARLLLRAERWTVKLFLAHWFTVAYRERFGTLPPKPYVLAQLGHAGEIQVPKWPF